MLCMVILLMYALIFSWVNIDKYIFNGATLSIARGGSGRGSGQVGLGDVLFALLSSFRTGVLKEKNLQINKHHNCYPLPLCKMEENMEVYLYTLTLLHSERPKLYGVLAVLSGKWLK